VRFLALCECADGPQHGRRAVVHHHRVFGSGELTEQLDDGRVAAAALTFVEIELEVRIPARQVREPGDGMRSERRAAQVGVQHHARRVDHPLQLRARQARERGDDVALFEAHVFPREDALTHRGHGFTKRGDAELSRVGRQKRRDRRSSQQLVDRRERAQPLHAGRLVHGTEQDCS